ncbi:Cyclic di-GMP phosphodiesterase response regulator RpfG [Calidithermus terrae]|uniref:Cyclic di-GMP phosphodiesterase response regulator RpfG n=1 Tax=Calidithermus terrae TaxID=1408545 RepID=A0A399ECX1_9DEIN|nr:GAF domain-containing protein [Calidithermus terrae]RIH81383.1 Cyclic di-GMP phosphodiesterase response regulator RpfG [Calidithermus terrae]
MAPAPDPRSAGARPAESKAEPPYATLLRTVEALATRSEAEAWQSILESAVAVVPGAEAGSLRLRQGERYRFVAQVGFGEEVLGIETSEEAAVRWYGDPEGWRRGEPRILSREQLHPTIELDPNNQHLVERIGKHMTQIQANLSVPIVLRGETVAEINLDSLSDPAAFDADSVHIARDYALQITALLVARRDREELEARAREFEVIEAATEALRGATSSRGIAERLQVEIARLMNSEHVVVGLLDPKDAALRLEAAQGLFEAFLGAEVPRGRGLAWRALEQRQPVHTPDATQDPRAYLPPARRRHKVPPHEQLVVPFFASDGSPLGVLGSGRRHPGRYSPLDVRLLQVVANVAATALERVRETEALRQRLHELEVLEQVSKALNDALAARDVLETVAGQITKLMGSVSSGIFLLSPDGQELRMAAARGSFTAYLGVGVPKGQGLSWAAVTSGQPVLSADALNDPRVYTAFRQQDLPRSRAVVPMYDSQGRVLGTLVASRNEPNAFSPKDVGVLQVIANVTASALERVRSSEGLQARLRELQTIADISQALKDAATRQEIGERVVSESARLLQSEHAALLTLTPSRQELEVVAGVGWFSQVEAFWLPRGMGLAWHALESRQTVYSPDVADDPHGFTPAQAREGGLNRSQITLPLLDSAGLPLGALICGRDAFDGYTPQEVQLVELIGNLTASALERVRTTEGLLERVHELEVIGSLTRALSDARSGQEVAQTLLAVARDLSHADWVALYRVSARDRLHLVAELPPAADFEAPHNPGLAWAALESGQPYLVRDAWSDPRIYRNGESERWPRSLVILPLLDSAGTPVGVLHVARQAAGALGEQDLHLLSLVGNVAGSAFERVQVSESLQTQIQEKQALLDLSHLIEETYPQVLERAIERIRQLAGAELVILGRRRGETVYAHSVAGELELPWPLAAEVSVATLSELGLFERGHVHVPDSSHYPALEPYARLGVYSFYVTMASRESGAECGLTFCRRAKGGWSESERRLMDGGARLIGALVARLERTQRLEDAYERALRAIGVALEARDRETAGHTDRVAAMATQLGQALKLDPTAIRDLRWGAYLHDIGKLTIPDAILLKPGRLSPDEFALMKTHAPMGDDLVRNLPFVPPAARQVVRHHHERWDGRGYPDGLKGETIPLPARIFAVCDVFDALTSERPYKSALGREAAALELWQSARTGHLDQDLVGLFLRLQQLDSVVEPTD